MCFLFHLNTLVNLIINNYFTTANCAFLISQNNGIEFISNVPIVNLKFTELNDINFSDVLYFGCQVIVINVDNPKDVIDKFEIEIKLQIQRFNTRRYLILPTENSVEFDAIFEVVTALNFVPEVLVIVPDYIETNDAFLCDECEIRFRLVTHRFVGVTGNNDLVLLDYWHSGNSSFEFEANLYPDKVSDMQGRVFKMATFSYQPYSIVGSTMDDTDGTEMQIALEYVRKHNGTIEFVVDEVHQWGQIYDNWTGEGILGNVVMDYADIGFGALYTWYHEFTYLDLSMPVVRTGITCLAPAPRLLAGWLAPFFPFNLTLWIAVVASFIFTVFAYAIIYYLNDSQQRRENDPDLGDNEDKLVIFFMMVRIFLLQSWPTIKSLNKAPIRYFLSSILILSLLIATCYNSGLASSMTVPRYEKAIQSVQDLADSDITWGATHEAWIFSIESTTQPTIVKIVKNFMVLRENELKKRTTTRDFAFSIERLPFGHYAIGEYITEDKVPYLLLMREDIYWEYCVFMTRKNSPFLDSLNELILRIHEAGLVYIWEMQVALKYLDYQVQLEVKLLSTQHHPDSGPVKLKITHVQGIYVIWMLGLTVAILCFISELCIYKFNQKNNK